MLATHFRDNLTEVLDDHGFGVVAVLRRVIRYQIMRQFVCHDNAPVNDSVRPRALLDQWEVQILKVSIVEEEGFVLIESNGASGVIVKYVHGRAIESENIRAVQQNRSEKVQRRHVGFHELGGAQAV